MVNPDTMLRLENLMTTRIDSWSIIFQIWKGLDQKTVFYRVWHKKVSPLAQHFLWLTLPKTVFRSLPFQISTQIAIAGLVTFKGNNVSLPFLAKWTANWYFAVVYFSKNHGRSNKNLHQLFIKSYSNNMMLLKSLLSLFL